MEPEHIDVTVATGLPRQPDTHQDCRGVASVLSLVGDKWSVLVIMLLRDGPRRFNELKRMINGISQRMLTLTLRGLERDGLVIRTIHPVIPPKVEYRLTELGFTLAEAFCGVWVWAADNVDRIAEARRSFDSRNGN